MSEISNHVTTVNTPEASLVAPEPTVDGRQISIIEMIRLRVGAASRTTETVTPLSPGGIPERRGVITGRTHDEVLEDTRIMYERRLKRRRYAASILGFRAV